MSTTVSNLLLEQVKLRQRPAALKKELGINCSFFFKNGLKVVIETGFETNFETGFDQRGKLQ